MSAHPLVAIGELIEAVATWNPATQAADAMFTYIDLSAVDQNEKLITAERRMRCEQAPSRARQIVKAGDVLVSTVRPNLNAVAVVPGHLDGATASTGFSVLRPKRPSLHGPYLFQWVKTPQFIDAMVRRATGANYPAVSDRIVAESALPVPPLVEQRRIAEILDKADALRAKRRAALAQLDTLGQSVFLDIYRNTSLPGRTLRLFEVAEKTRGSFVNGPFGSDLLTTELRDEGVPVVYIRDIRSGEYVRVSQVCVSEAKARALAVCSVEPGDVLVTKVGDPPGMAAIYSEECAPAIVTQDVIRIRVEREIATPEFVVAYLNSPLGIRRISEITVQATRARFSLGDFKRIFIDLPALDVQQELSRQVRYIADIKNRLRRSLVDLDDLFASLQHRAFVGRL